MPRPERSTTRTDSDRRARWTAEEAGRVLHALVESGLSQKEFCEREGLVPERLRRWQRKLGRQRAVSSPRSPRKSHPRQTGEKSVTRTVTTHPYRSA